MLETGTLARYISGLWVTGLTSNPTIFEHAIAGSADYDDAIARRLDRRLSTEQLFFEIALEDIIAAAELFRPVYEATGGADGFVSLEVSPTLADDTEGTIAEARRLHGEAARPNVLIKVPGTKAGVVAIEELIYAGIPINVTLLFSREHYLAAAEAYLKGLERRVEKGASPNVASVASLFISRWDAATAPKLPEHLRNRLGIAIGQRAFKAYRDLLASERWKRLAAAGARPQRMLWASTSAKDPTLPDTYYVSALAAADTVDTMPEATLLAFGRHGSVGALLSPDATAAEAVIAEIAQAGIDVDALADELQVKGRDSFDDSFAKLLQSIETKAATLREARDRGAEFLGPASAAADAAQADLSGRGATGRIWSLDYTLWDSNPTEISNRLGWLVSPHQMEEQVEDLEAFTKQLKDDGFTHVLWSGMGGSSLFPQVLRQAFGVGAGGLDLRVLDTSDPGTVHRYAEELPTDKTLFVFASKSGGTLEPRSHLAFFWDRIRRPEQFAVVTDPGTELDQLATRQNFRRVFRANPNLGGRYSALSHFGIVAGALLGVDIDELLRRAGAVIAAVGGLRPAREQSGAPLRRGARRRGQGRARQVHPGHAGGDRRVRHVARAADRGVHGQARRRHPADRRRGSRPAGGLRQRPHLREPGPAGRARCPGGGGTARGPARLRRPLQHRLRGGALGVRDRDGRRRARDQSLRSAQRRGRQAGRRQGARGGDAEHSGGADRVDPGHGQAGRLHRDPGVHRYRIARHRGAAAGAHGAARPLSRRHHGRDRPALPALDRTAAQGRRPSGVFLQIVGDDPVDVAIPGKAFGFAQLKQAQAAGDYLALKDKGRRVARVARDDVLKYGQ